MNLCNCASLECAEQIHGGNWKHFHTYAVSGTHIDYNKTNSTLQCILHKLGMLTEPGILGLEMYS